MDVVLANQNLLATLKTYLLNCNILEEILSHLSNLKINQFNRIGLSELGHSKVRSRNSQPEISSVAATSFFGLLHGGTFRVGL